MATMKNKQTAKKTSVDADKLNDLLTIVHNNHHDLRNELAVLTHNYQEAVKQIGILEKEKEEEGDKLHQHILRLKKENKKLQKEIKEQKEEYEDDMLNYQNLIDDITDHPDWQELIDDHEMEMDKLKEKNKELEKYKEFTHHWSEIEIHWKAWIKDE